MVVVRDGVADSLNKHKKVKYFNIFVKSVGSDIYISVQEQKSYQYKPNFNLTLRTFNQIPGINAKNKRFGSELLKEKIQNALAFKEI